MAIKGAINIFINFNYVKLNSLEVRLIIKKKNLAHINLNESNLTIFTILILLNTAFNIRKS